MYLKFNFFSDSFTPLYVIYCSKLLDLHFFSGWQKFRIGIHSYSILTIRRVIRKSVSELNNPSQSGTFLNPMNPNQFESGFIRIEK